MGVQNRNSNNSVVYKKNRYIQPTETEKKKETEKKTSTAKTASKPASELTKTKYMTDVGMNVPVTYGVINPNEAKTQAEAKQRDTTKALTQRAVNSNANMTPVRSQGSIQREVSEYLSQTKRMSNVASVMNSRDYNNNYYSGLESMSKTMKTTNAEYRSWYYQLRKEIESNRKQNGDGWTDTMLRAIESTEPTYSYLDRTEKRLSAMVPTYKYEGVVHADDFDEYSKKGAAIKNPSYDRANQYNLKNKVSFYRDNADKISKFADKPEGQGLIYTYMTDKEVATYNYWLAKEGEKSAERYLDIITPKLNQRYSIDMNGKTADFSRNNKFAASALSVGSNLISPIGYVEDAVRTISGKPIDIYSPAHQPSNMTSTIRNTVSDDINSGVGKFLYQTGMSMADFLATTAVTGGFGSGAGAVNEALSLGLMGGSAATNAVIDAKNRGLSDKQAFALGTVAGAAEVVTEKISVEALLDKTSLGKNAVGYFIKNVLSEGSEEVGSDVINFVADILISKDKSEWETAIRNYKQQGLSDKDAFKRAALDQAEQMGLDFLGGALSGGVMGGGFYAFNAPAINSYDRTVGAQIKDRDNVNTLLQTASEMDKKSEAYKLAQEINGVNTAIQENTEKHGGEADTKGEAQAIVKDFKKSNRQTQRLEKKQSKLTSDKNIGMLYRQTTSAAAENIKNNSDRMIAERLNSLGETGYGETLVKAVKKSAFGESLSIKERKALNTSKYGQRVINELSGVTRNSGEYTSEWTQSNSDVQKFNRIGDMLNKTVKVGGQAQQVTVKGQKHKVNSFVVTNEGTKVRLDNGEAVKADTLTYDNKASGEIINEAAEFSAPVAKIYAENYQAGQDTADYHDSFLVAYTLGYQSAGADVYYNEVKARVGNRISGQQAFAAYSAGQFQRRIDNEAQHVRADRKRKAKQITNITGTFEDSAVKGVELNGKQKAAVGVLRNISEITGVNVRLVQSTTDENGDYVGKNGSYDSNTNTVEIDINAGLNNIADIPELKSAMLRTASHELTHYIQHWSGTGYDTLKNAVINFLERTKGKGTVEEFVQNKIDSYQNSDVKLTRDEALDEVVADSCEMMLKDSTAIQELAREDMTLVEKIKAWIDNFVNNIKKAFERVEANSTEAVILADYQADMENIQKIWDEALKKAVNNNSTLDTIDTDGGVQYNVKVSEYNKPISLEDVKEFRNTFNGINKSVNDFSFDEINKTQKWAYKFYKQIGIKSPFFRAWLGDWRAFDQNKITIASKKGAAKGEVKNDDTKWNINVSAVVFDETKSHKSLASKKAVPYLDYIQDIIKNAVLLDTMTVGKAKSENSIFMHSMYALADIGNGVELLKLYVEEMYNPSLKDDKLRAYKLRNIKNALKASGKVQVSPSSVTNTLNAATTVSDLYFIVKNFDKDFFAGKEINSALLNDDGSPKVLYHQTGNDFTEFDLSKTGAGSHDDETPYGIFLKDNDKDIGLKGKKQMPLYAYMRNPLIVKDRGELVNHLRKNTNYKNANDLRVKTDKDYKEKFDNAKEAFNNYILKWRENNPTAKRTDIYNDPEFQKIFEAEDKIASEWSKEIDNISEKSKKLVTSVLKKEGYDGVILENDKGSFGRKTNAYIVFDSNQVKSAENNIGTFSPYDNDIQFSLRDNYTSTRSLARDLKTELSSSLSADELDSYMKHLVDTAADVETSADFEALRDVTRSYAEAFVNSSNVKTEIDDTQKKELANYFKGKHYKMTPELRAEVEYQYGSYKDFKDKMFGKKIYFSENAETTLDKDWAEICEMFPGIFDESISDKDQPMAVLEAFDGFTAVPDETAESGERVEWLTDKLVDYVTNIAKSEAAVSINPRTYGADLSSRELLANALESVAQTPAEREHLQKYQAQIDSLDEMSEQLAETRSQIHSISFTKGSDRSQLTALRNKAQILENRINVLDKKLLRFEATKVLRDVAEREKQKAIKKAKQQGRESLKDYRENRKAADIKKSIARVKSDITKRLLNPTDGRYVPLYLVQKMVDVCNAINLDTGRLAPDGRITKAQQKRNDITAALNNLRMQYDEMKKDSNSDYSSEYDSEISLALGNLINAVNGKQVREMTNTQLNEVYSLLKQIRGTLIDATQQIGLNERISNFERGMSIIDEQRHIRGVSKNIFGKYDKFVAANALNPIRNIRRMTAYNENSELAAIFNEINRGVRKADKFTMEAYKAFEELTRDKENAKAYDEALTKAMDVDITDIDGNPVKMSKMVAMQLYMSWQRELSSGGKLSHLLNGGAIIPDFKLMSKGDIAKAVSAEYAQRIDVNQNVIDTIYEGFSDFDKAYIKAASDFFNGKAQKAINDTMRVLKHRDVATSKNYIPFKVDQDFVVKEIKDTAAVQQTLTSLGMLKDTVVNAGQPLVMTGLNNVLKTHIDDTARIYGLAIPVRNFNKVWNVKSHNNVSVKQQISKNWGIEGTKVIEQTIKDIQGKRTRPNDFLTKALDTAQSAFVTSALNNNISVAIKQAASLYTAFAQLDYKPAMVGKFFKTAAQYKSIYQEIDEHTAQHWRRRQGLSTQELGDIAESVTKTSKFLNKIPTALNPTKWIQGIDCLTTATFWEMCKSDVEKHTDYEVGSDEYWQAVTDMYDKVIEDTQPMYDTLHRPEAQKTTNTLARQFIMFRTQPLQNAGIIYDAYGNLKTQIMTKDKEKIKSAKKEFFKACSSQFVSALVFTAMTLIAGALKHNLNRYRDDDDELHSESVTKTMLEDMVNTLAGVLIPIGGSELETAISGFINGSKFGDLNLLNVPVVDFINDFTESLGKAFKEPSVNNLKNLTFNFSQLFGIPTKNAYNIVNGVVLHVKDAANGEFGSFEAGLKRSNGTNYNRAVKALMDGNKDKYNNVLQELSDNGVDNDKIKSGIKSKIRDYVLDGEISQKNAEKWLKDYCGDNEAHWTVEKWKAQRENGKDYEYNKYLNLENAVKSGKPIENEYNNLVNNGVKEDTAISKVKSFALTYYLDGKISKEQALDYYGKYLDKSEDDTEKSFNSAVTGRYRNMYQDGKIDTDTLKNSLVKNGMDEEKAESKVRAWDFSEKYTTNADWSEDTINRYYSKVEPYGISVEDYDTYLVGYKDCKGTDNDGDGVTDSGSKKVQVLAVIDKLPISNEQKDVLYYLNNWSAKKIYEAPWH